ncbi:thioredoxin [Phytohabitans suffuscus]|uniref:Thioredoxin n=1 Tax=Phytohabitans suffuscus TaxID=624315 RepID=A0A6F8YV78_9ACTN|nr:thioredoxin [Phytohabitans suffuscus]BCB90022.1 thioredoxin-1 [Phytohabitans suffuscus]
MGEIRDVTDDDFRETVLESDRPVLVDFWSVSCGPCRMLAPVLEDLARAQDKLVVVKMDVAENPRTSSEYAVSSIPTMNVYSGGELVKTIVGAKSRTTLNAELADFLE